MALKALGAGTAVFVDTSAWYEFFVPNQPQFEDVFGVLSDKRFRLVTSDYVLDELFSLLKARKQYRRHKAVWEALMDRDNAELLFTIDSDLHAAYDVYRKFTDKGWSFTDCVSFQHIRKLRIPYACSTDEHFREFGIVTALPGLS
jgi:predicted nucleic acid-binding protein